MDNCFTVIGQVLTLFNVGYTKNYLKNRVLSHPDHPSLLSVSDILNTHNIKNIAIKVDENKFRELPTPFIAQVTKNHQFLFHTITNITEGTVLYIDEYNRKKRSSTLKYLQQITGVSLLLDGDTAREEDGYKKKLKQIKFEKAILIGVIVFIILFLVSRISESELFQESLIKSTFSLGYFLTKIAGLTVALMLLWYEVDEYNPTIQKFCSGDKTVNCSAVLKSKYAKIGDYLNLSLLSAAYFITTAGILIVDNFSNSSIQMMGWLSLFTIPFVLGSLYYQGVVIGQWCKFCMLIQFILLIEIVSSLLNLGVGWTIDYGVLLLGGALFTGTILGWKVLKPLLTAEKEMLFYKRGLSKIKNNKSVFQSLLQKSEPLVNSTGGLGVQLGNTASNIKVIKVCNPYCGPCAKVHPVLEKLVLQNKIELQVLFTAHPDLSSLKTKVVAHFLAIASAGDNKVTQQALDDWYLSSTKNYDDFAVKYPIKEKILETQLQNIKLMRDWCTAEKITHTPTIFVNGYRLPKEYKAEDLEDVFF